ncbi:hypothetical protein BJX63DRAFT_423244 [Aspergillus granulosus]|uniref:Nucleotide-diphospho-sugar transferase domain-containing protein n=1 Tax=Aspergillus granulosus TaxID=176169 RepID=A0ABR4H5Y1_9EURO
MVSSFVWRSASSPRNANPSLVITPIFTRYIGIAIILGALILLAFRTPRLVNSHLYDLSFETYFSRQFQVFALTGSCDRFTPDVAAHFDYDSLTLVPNQLDMPECAALSRKQLALSATNDPGASKDDLFRAKYAQVLDSCASGNKAKCLILEDDIVFLHRPQRTREVLVENTIPLFNDGETDTFDCTKRGFGWLSSTTTGMGSQCRVYSKHSAPCMSQCLRDQRQGSRLDTGLANCQVRCKLNQKRFLLVVHGGLSSTMERPAVP